jgi:putative oxidoreductase
VEHVYRQYDKEASTMNTTQQNHVAFLIGRVMLGGMYLYSGITNVIELGGKAGYAASKGLPAPAVFVALASLLLVVGGIGIVAGLRPRLGVAVIVLFLIPVTLIMHNFWAAEGIQRMSELHAFKGNLGLIGAALIFLAILQPWPLSLDGWLASLDAAERKQQGMNTA